MNLQALQATLALAGIQIVSTARINNCGTNLHLEGGGIYCIYDSGKFLLQGKPTPGEASLYAVLVSQSEPKTAETPKHEMQEWEEWLAANYSERQA